MRSPGLIGYARRMQYLRTSAAPENPRHQGPLRICPDRRDEMRGMGPASTSWNATGVVMVSHLWQILSKSDRKFMPACNAPPTPRSTPSHTPGMAFKLNFIPLRPL